MQRVRMADLAKKTVNRDSELNTACRVITGCLKPTNVEDLYMLARIAPHDIIRDVCALVEKKKQESNVAHSLYGQNPTEREREVSTQVAQ